MGYICHSGGCPGADITWENEGYKYGVITVAYSFSNHVQESKNPKVLTVAELLEGFDNVKIANNSLKRNIYKIPAYVKQLLSRNWFQVKNSDCIYAIGEFSDDNHRTVNGGTGWAVQMAIDNGKLVCFFEQNLNTWFLYNYDSNKFEQIDYTPTLTENFAGIGTRDINENGINAIKSVLTKTFSNKI